MIKALQIALALSCFATICHGSGNIGTQNGPTSLTPEQIAEYFTEVKVTLPGEEVQRCPQRVLDERKKVAENGGPSLGVEPTVGLGAALLIFIFVGVFAAGIAQAFQLVR